jgi:hypothetical protein
MSVMVSLQLHLIKPVMESECRIVHFFKISGAVSDALFVTPSVTSNMDGSRHSVVRSILMTSFMESELIFDV